MLSHERLSLAAIKYGRGFDVDAVLVQSSAELRLRGIRVGGLIQRSAGGRGECAASLHVVDLCLGRTFDIWEGRGACARGCRLDERGLLDAEPTIMAAIAGGLDLLVINRFGRAESLGRGLIGCFSAALEAGVPVLTAVRAPYEDAWCAFHGGLGRDLPPEESAVIRWATCAARRAPDGPVSEPAPATVA